MVRSSIRWLLVVAPCQTFKALGSASGSVPVVVFMYIELTAAIAGGVSTLYAVIKQSDAVEGFWNGVIAGHLLAGCMDHLHSSGVRGAASLRARAIRCHRGLAPQAVSQLEVSVRGLVLPLSGRYSTPGPADVVTPVATDQRKCSRLYACDEPDRRGGRRRRLVRPWARSSVPQKNRDRCAAACCSPDAWSFNIPALLASPAEPVRSSRWHQLSCDDGTASSPRFDVGRLLDSAVSH